MQIVSIEDNLHVLSKPVSGINEKIVINLSSAELAQKAVTVSGSICQKV